MPLGDNVQSISDRQPSGARSRVAAPRPAEPAPYDNLLSLATEIEERDLPRTRRPHLAPVPTTPVPTAPVPTAPPRPLPEPPTQPPTVAPPVPRVRPSPDRERVLLLVSAGLALVIGVLLVWGTDIERLLRPGIGDRGESGEVETGDDASSSPAAPPDGDLAPAQSSSSLAPSTTAAPNVSEGTAGSGVQDPSSAAAAPTVAACDATSVWPTVIALNDVSPIAVAWVTCTERYATAGLVPADAPPETPPSVIVSLRSDNGTWALLSVGEPANCAPGASAIDPAFPTSLCP